MKNPSFVPARPRTGSSRRNPFREALIRLRKPILFLALCCLAVALPASVRGDFSAGPPPPATLTVPDDYATIQAAVDAAQDGDTVRVKAGTYRAQVLIADKRLTLQGEPGAKLEAPDSLAETLLEFGSSRPTVLGIARSEAEVSGLEIDGRYQSHSLLVGVYFIGSSGSLKDSTIRNIQWGGQIALLTSNPAQLGLSVQQVTIRNNRFFNNRDALHLTGDDGTFFTSPVADPETLRLTARVEGNDIKGWGSFDGPRPPHDVRKSGIVVSVGAAVEIIGNTVSGSASDESSYGIVLADVIPLFWPSFRSELLLLQKIVVRGNLLEDSQIGLAAAKANGVVIEDNTIRGGSQGILLSGTDAAVIGNTFENVPAGIVLLNDPALGLAVNARLIGNTFAGIGQDSRILQQPGVTGTVILEAVPAVQIEPAVRLSWPNAAAGFLLESAPSVNGPWTAVPGTPTAGGNGFSLSARAEQAARFYRLRWP